MTVLCRGFMLLAMVLSRALGAAEETIEQKAMLQMLLPPPGSIVKPVWPPGYEHSENSIKMELVHIPPGSYLCYGNDITATFLFPKPKGFQVTIEKEFYIGAYEVTQEQYLKVMEINPGIFKMIPEQPVNKVSWNDAMEFCRKLSDLPAEKAAGRVYSLPSEREWQFAARAGSKELFTYGTSDELTIATVAICRDPYTDIVPQGVSPVGSKLPNLWGLYDVLGNVWEWVLDAWPADAPPEVVPASTGSAALTKGENRVIVGGGWDNDFRMCNLAARYSAPPSRKADNIGFRVRCLITAPAAK